ncbi:MAG: hypothetical protein EPO68_15600 [Planctomycetota bacterium]|nr:MAG: hypothetical protein EPO68_15600 [Planctomycetota bacterium]
MSRFSSSARAALAALLAMGAALAAATQLCSCRITSAKLWNLEQVHGEDGSARRVGDVRGDIEHVVKSGGLPFRPAGLFAQMGDFGAERDRPIRDPLGDCLENQIELGQCDLSDPAERGRAIAMYAFLAADDDWFLARERAVVECAKLARLEAVAAPLDPPPRPADAQTVRDAVQRVYRAYGVPFGGASAAPNAPPTPFGLRPLRTASIEDALRELSALELDVAGARRALAATSALVARAQTLERLGAGLAGVQAELRRRTLALALGAALTDDHEYVRASAYDAVLRLGAHPDAARLQRALLEEGPDVALAALRVLEQRGLPPQAPVAADAAPRSSWVALLVDMAPSHEGRRSAAVCRALCAVEPQGPRSQRFEEWLRWWDERSAPQGP